MIVQPSPSISSVDSMFSTFLVFSLLLLTEGRRVDRNEALIGYRELYSDDYCQDENDNCSDWAAKKPSECLRNPVWMRHFCAASCTACGRAMQPWAGHATASGTARFAAGGLGFKVAEGFFRQHVVRYTGVDTPPAPLTLSSLGVGTYLGSADKETDEAVANAIVQSVANGWNVVDTAANYRWGHAERSVGQALLTLRATGSAERDMLFVSTKAGYGADDLLTSLRADGKIVPGDVVRGHCMAPDCLSGSLQASLERLGLGSMDLFYIHNPAESQLGQLGRQAFMERLRSAFQFCEEARAQGRIKAYGLATWSCFRVPPESQREYLSLRQVARLAEDVGGQDHGFRYIQLPVNIKMREAWSEPWQEGVREGTQVTLLQAAEELGIGVFSSGPLMEAQLLGSPQLQAALEAAPSLRGIPGTAPKLMQLARSCPGVLTTLVGHKASAHVDANLAVGRWRPLDGREFGEAVRAVDAALGQRV